MKRPRDGWSQTEIPWFGPAGRSAALEPAPSGWDFISDLLATFAWFLLVSIPGYIMVQNWLRSTFASIFFILAVRVRIVMRQKSYDKSD